MRFVLIDSRHRKVFDCNTPIGFGDLISRMLRCDFPNRIEIAPEVDLWVSSEPKRSAFRFFSDGPEYSGDGFLCGRTKYDEFKSLPRRLNIEAIRNWLEWPERRPETQPRRPINLRPAGFPLAGPSLDPYHGIAPGSARESPYVMQMYG